MSGFTLILCAIACAIAYIIIRIWTEVAISRLRLIPIYNWYEKYAAGMQAKIDISSIFICNLLYNRTGMQSMQFTPPEPSKPINGMKKIRAV